MHYSFSSDERRGSLLQQLKTRLILTICLFASALVIHTMLSLYVASLQASFNTQSLTLRDDSHTLVTAMIDQETGLRGYLVTNNRLFLAPFYGGHTTYVSTLRQLQTLLNTNNFPHTGAALMGFKNSAAVWYQQYALPQLAHRNVATALQGKELFDAFRIQGTRLQVASELDITQQQDRVSTINNLSTFLNVLLFLLVIFVLWQAFTRVGNSLHKQLALFEEATTRLGKGNLTARVPPLKSLELDRFGRSFNTMAEALQQQKQAAHERDILESVRQLNALLTSTFDLEMLVDNFLSKALTVLQLHLAALYLYDSTTKRIVLKGAQGFDFDELTKEFALGEGTVGTTAQSHIPIHLQQPTLANAEHFIAKTILGHVLPASLYQIPLVQGKELVGVLVFGSLYPMTENARNTLDVVSSNLAAVISHIKSYASTQSQAEALAQKNREQEQSNVALRIQRDELRVLNTALEETNRARSQFLSIMTHELRTPLTAMLGFSQIVLRDMEHEQSRSRSNIERVIKNGQHLLNLINDALDLIRLESGHMSITMSTVSLPALITEVIEGTQTLIGEKDLRLISTIDPELNTIESDPAKLRQILLNLFSNAIKFTEHGEVSVRARRQPGIDQEGDQIILTIQDTGIGIAPEIQERIFDAFYQGDSTITRKYGGTGLGLSVVRQLTLLLGGTLVLDSQLGQGSTFTLLLPQHPTETVEEPFAQIPEKQPVTEASPRYR